MKILMLTGSPHPAGASALLADEYTAGAEAAGHQVLRFNAAQLDIHPCIGCDHCRQPASAGRCVFEDDMQAIYPHLLDADVVTLVTPLYYFDMTAQLKTVVDRFYAVNPELRNTPHRFELLAVSGADADWLMDAMVPHYKTMGRYLHWPCRPPLLAVGYPKRADIENSEWPAKARAYGQGAGGDA